MVGLRLLASQEMSRWQRVQRVMNSDAAVWRFEFKDDTTLQGTTTATVTTQRMATLLQTAAFDAPTISQMAQALREQARPGPAVPDIQIAIRQTLASLLVPGLGQWMQGRSSTALRFFLGWLVMLVFSAIPVIWVLWAPRAAVSLNVLAYSQCTVRWRCKSMLSCRMRRISIWCCALLTRKTTKCRPARPLRATCSV